ncbi:MAG: YwiC-like family protein [Anaerolineae bacterium]|nr:YwiC-like family protein [Anaerolineae bacterium]
MSQQSVLPQPQTLTRSARRTAIKSVALPTEHGGWGFLLEPIVLGLLLAASIQGLLFSVAVLGAFLLHQPFKMVLKDRQKQRYLERTKWAYLFLLLYGALTVIPLVLLLPRADPKFWLPIAIAFPLLIVQLHFDLHNHSRTLIAELAGAVALGSSATVICLFSGWSLSSALLLWLIMTARSIPSILYVRARLRLERQHSNQLRSNIRANTLAAGATHVIVLLSFVVLVHYELIPILSLLAMILLTARTLIGLSGFRKCRRAAAIGVMEMGYGLLMVLLTAIGFSIPL